MDKDQKPIIDAFLDTEFNKVVTKTIINHIKFFQDAKLSKRDLLHIMDEAARQKDQFAETILKRYGLDTHYDKTYYHDYLCEMFRKQIVATRDLVGSLNFKDLH